MMSSFIDTISQVKLTRIFKYIQHFCQLINIILNPNIGMNEKKIKEITYFACSEILDKPKIKR